jgi:hypothetical protein
MRGLMVASNENETKEQRFKRIASKRTENVLEAIRKLGNCSNKSIYGYSEQDISKIFSAVDSEIKRIKTIFSGKSKSNKFSL